mmetsp:Transcript_85653/g.135915  ORF Transcript_85653/g.135915 Transcript_85653/m.135915 type:complete len:201 (-) Transcript_85653:180-782(-)
MLGIEEFLDQLRVAAHCSDRSHQPAISRLTLLHILRSYLIEEHGFRWISKHASPHPNICRNFFCMSLDAPAIMRELWILKGIGIVLNSSILRAACEFISIVIWLARHSKQLQSLLFTGLQGNTHRLAFGKLNVFATGKFEVELLLHLCIGIGDGGRNTALAISHIFRKRTLGIFASEPRNELMDLDGTVLVLICLLENVA